MLKKKKSTVKKKKNSKKINNSGVHFTRKYYFRFTFNSCRFFVEFIEIVCISVKIVSTPICFPGLSELILFFFVFFLNDKISLILVVTTESQVSSWQPGLDLVFPFKWDLNIRMSWECCPESHTFSVTVFLSHFVHWSSTILQELWAKPIS